MSACHTVGFGLPTGFTNETATPHLAGVQCENCHGPAANHAANPDDFTVRPRLELAATTCGGCHTEAHQPTYDEWKTSGHSAVVEDMNPPSRISSCGRCHSGSARMSLLKGTPLPIGDANVPVTCVTCHDPHQQTANPAQLRNPVYSTANYSLATTDDFSSKYDPNINMCGQCHNDRGASWTSSSRPPHHSPQYNMLLGSVGVMADGQAPNDPGAHAFLEKQCVSCHMQSKAFVSEAQPAITGHKFTVELYDTCYECHTDPQGLLEFMQTEAMPANIDEVKRALDLWATTKAPEPLRNKYGALAWEYTIPGSLSSGSGPDASEQALIPDLIKKARFDLYLVVNDGSFGVHNPRYAITLLDTALNWVKVELNP
jgi:formate-dependent nitrite reductase cytochrome c552 subunit